MRSTEWKATKDRISDLSRRIGTARREGHNTEVLIAERSKLLEGIHGEVRVAIEQEELAEDGLA